MDDNTEKIARLESRISMLAVLSVVSIVMSIATGLGLLLSMMGSEKQDGGDGRYYAERSRRHAAANESLQAVGTIRHTALPYDPVETIADADAIVLAENVEKKGKFHHFVTEILWVAPGVTFDYVVGDEIGHPLDKDRGSDYGERELMICTGNPARMVSASAIYGGRLPAYGDIKLSTFRELIEARRKKDTAREADGR
jgi:hypothetical protein